jgi:hypothetical protein
MVVLSQHRSLSGKLNAVVSDRQFFILMMETTISSETLTTYRTRSRHNPEDALPSKWWRHFYPSTKLYVLTFQKTLSCHEGGKSRFLRNVCTPLPDYTALHARLLVRIQSKILFSLRQRFLWLASTLKLLNLIHLEAKGKTVPVLN